MYLIRGVTIAAAVLLMGACSTPSDIPVEDPAPSTPPLSAPPSANSTPTPLTTDGPSVSAAPSTEDDSSPASSPEPGTAEAEKWAATVPAFREYWDVINETYAAGGAAEATDGMKQTMTGTQLDYWEKTFADFAERGRRYEGKNVVTSANPTFVEIGAESGTAEIEYCVDMSETRAFESNGDPLVKDGDYQSGVAGVMWVDGRWKVAGFTPESGVVPSC